MGGEYGDSRSMVLKICKLIFKTYIPFLNQKTSGGSFLSKNAYVLLFLYYETVLH